MLRTVLATAMAAVVLVAAPAPVRAEPSLAQVFADPGAWDRISLSPSGAKIAVVGWKDSKHAIRIYHAGRIAEGPVAEYVLGPAPSVAWIDWKSDSRLVFGLRMIDETFADQERGLLITRTMLVTADAGLKAFRNPVIKPKSATAMPQFHDDVVSMLRGDPDHVLLQIDWHTPLRPSIYKVNLRTFEAKKVIDRRGGVGGWMLDTADRPRVAVMEKDEGKGWWSIVGEDGSVRPLPHDLSERARFLPQGVDGQGRLIVVSNHEGETTGLYAYDLERGEFVERLFRDETYDVAGVGWSRDGKRVTAVSYADDEYRLIPIGEDQTRRLARLREVLGTDDVGVMSESLDGSKVVATTWEKGRRAETFLVDLTAGTAESLGRFDPDLDGRALGKVVAADYKARDGLRIPAFITLPPGVNSLEEAKGLPFVVMPHGGPHARDTADYDWWAQFTASLGYAVLQPNFRGSSGYGDSFREAGVRQWGEAIQDDVADGAAWLVVQGYADPNRMCVAGGSFGGYTALVASVEDKARYRCAVSLAGVSDLLELIRNGEAYVGGKESMREFVGRAWRDRSRLVENSPARRAGEVGVPVLLVHGDADTVVLPTHSRLMHRRLKESGKAVTYVELPLADHSLSREKDRLAFLKAYEAFLKQHLGAGRAGA